MADQEEAYLLRGKIQIDDSYLAGKLPTGKAGRGSQNKVPILAAVSLNKAGSPVHADITLVSGLSLEAIADWAKHYLVPGSQVLTDGLACFRAVTTAGCRSSAGSTRCWATSRPASTAPSMPSTLTRYSKRKNQGYCFHLNCSILLACPSI
jgi:hypothetical protein